MAEIRTHPSFYSVLVTYKNEDPIKSGHIKQSFFRFSRAAYSVVMESGQNSNSSKLPARMKEDPSKNEGTRVVAPFSYKKSIGFFRCSRTAKSQSLWTDLGAFSNPSDSYGHMS